MGTTSFPGVDARSTLEDLKEIVAETNQLLDFVINGNLDVKNIRANSITADRLKVLILSAITANLGHITAGLIESVEIYGSYIATAKGTYPMCEMSNTDNIFGAFAAVNKFIKIIADDGGQPILSFVNGSSVDGQIAPFSVGSALTINTTVGKGHITISAGQDLNLFASNGSGNKVRIKSWNDIYGNDNVQTLQTALNAKANGSGVNGSFVAGAKTVTVSNGIITSII